METQKIEQKSNSPIKNFKKILDFRSDDIILIKKYLKLGNRKSNRKK